MIRYLDRLQHYVMAALPEEHRTVEQAMVRINNMTNTELLYWIDEMRMDEERTTPSPRLRRALKS